MSASAGRLAAGRAGSRAVVLCYHSIHPSLPFASASPELFRAHLDWLIGSCDVVPLDQIPALAMGPERERPAVALTFDDGYHDNHSHALPLLQEAGAPATFFVTVGLVDRDRDVVERMARIRGTSREEVAAVTWDEACELAAAGHEVASHTWSHPVLTRLPEREARNELQRSKSVLEDRLGRSVTSFAYPFGKPGAHFTSQTERFVGEVGYSLAAAVIFRRVLARDSRLVLPRFFATRDDVQTLAAKVTGRWDWLGVWQERTPRWLARRISPADYLDMGDVTVR